MVFALHMSYWRLQQMGRGGGIKISFMLLKYINEKTNLLSDKKIQLLFYHYNITPRCYAIEFHNFISTFVQCQIYLPMVS